MGIIGESYTRQRRGAGILADTINQGMPLLEGLSRLATGQGISQQQIAGFATLLKLVGVGTAVGKAGPDGITAADWTDPAAVIYGKGDALIYVTTDQDIGRPGVVLEKVLNPYSGTVAANHVPLFLIRIAGIWFLNNFQCP